MCEVLLETWFSNDCKWVLYITVGFWRNVSLQLVFTAREDIILFMNGPNVTRHTATLMSYIVILNFIWTYKRARNCRRTLCVVSRILYQQSVGVVERWTSQTCLSVRWKIYGKKGNTQTMERNCCRTFYAVSRILYQVGVVERWTSQTCLFVHWKNYEKRLVHKQVL